MKTTLTLPKLPDPARARDYFSDKMEFTTGPVELQRAMNQDEVIVVDVRATEDYRKGHIPGAISLPREQWNNPRGLRRDKTNVLYCYSQVCHLAPNIAVSLAEDGYPVMELEGGFEGWKQNDLPVETSAGVRKAEVLTPADRSPKQENL